MTNKQWLHRVIDRAEDVPVPYQLPLPPVSRRKLEEHFATDEARWGRIGKKPLPKPVTVSNIAVA